MILLHLQAVVLVFHIATIYIKDILDKEHAGRKKLSWWLYVISVWIGTEIAWYFMISGTFDSIT